MSFRKDVKVFLKLVKQFNQADIELLLTELTNGSSGQTIKREATPG